MKDVDATLWNGIGNSTPPFKKKHLWGRGTLKRKVLAHTMECHKAHAAYHKTDFPRHQHRHRSCNSHLRIDALCVKASHDLYEVGREGERSTNLLTYKYYGLVD